jgi:hypothetical protein
MSHDWFQIRFSPDMLCHQSARGLNLPRAWSALPRVLWTALTCKPPCMELHERTIGQLGETLLQLSTPLTIDSPNPFPPSFQAAALLTHPAQKNWMPGMNLICVWGTPVHSMFLLKVVDVLHAGPEMKILPWFHACIESRKRFTKRHLCRCWL